MKNILIKSACIIMLVMVAFSCTETIEVENEIAKKQIDRLETCLKSLKTEKNTANLGYKKGQIPPENVTILDEAMTSVNALLSKIYDRLDVSEDNVKAEENKVAKAVADFRAKALNADAPPHPLIVKYDLLKKEMSDANFGLGEGDYPDESKQILQNAINAVVELMGKIRAGQTVSDKDINDALGAADKAITDFRATIRTEDFLPEDVKKLRVSKAKVEAELKGAAFGYLNGQYPEKSKSILNNALAVIDQLINKILGDKAYTKDDVNNAIAGADNAITAFKATKRTKDADKILFVNGPNKTHIEFGTAAQATDFLQFGSYRDQVYTVELWLKITGPSCAFLSTFLEKAGGGHQRPERCGWFVNYWDDNKLRMGWALDIRWDLNEPWFHFNRNDGWVHFAVVYNDKGVDGSNGRQKLYQNGVLKSVGYPITQEASYNGDFPESHNDPEGAEPKGFERVPMIGFGQANPYGRDAPAGEVWRRSQGYMKDIRIWTSAKTQAEIQKLMNGTTVVTGTESDLRCCWTLKNEDLKDKTGKYTATLVGTDFKWEFED